MRNFTLKHFIVFMGLTAISVLAQAQIGSSKWSFSNPKPFGFSTFSLSYADDNTALAVGNSGGIAKTTDGGGTWMYTIYTMIQDGAVVKPTLNEVQFVNSSVAYAVGTNGAMIKSMDGGNNWTALTTPFAAESEIFTVFFTDANTGYIGGTGDPVTKQCTLYKTINGGGSWTAEHTFPAPVPDYYEAGLFRIRFSASGVGYFTGATGSVWKYDAGTWTDYSITETTVFPNVSHDIDTVIYVHSWDEFSDTSYYGYADNVYGLEEQNYRGLAIIDDSVIVISAQNNGGLIRINTSTPAGSYLMLNNGNAYSYDKYTPIGSPQMYSISCKDGMHIYVTGSDGNLISSSDKGYTWGTNKIYPEGTVEAKNGFYGLDISSAGRIGLTGTGGIMADSATTWRRPYKNAKGGGGFFGGYSMESISFADDKNGVGVGSGGAILRTQNGGDTWEDISNASFQSWERYTSVNYLSPTVMYASASNGQFYKSADKGSSFDLLFEEPSVADQRRLTSMHFTDEEHGWMTAFVGYLDMVTYETTYHSIIYRSADGGMSWDSATTIFPTSADYITLNDIKFFSDNKLGYAVGGAGMLYKSMDGGKTWVAQTVPDDAVGKSLRSISIIDADIAFICGEQGVVMKTTNGGTDWTMCNTGLPGGYTRYGKILMNDAARGLVFSSGGNLYSTTDGGANWMPYYAPTNIDFYAAAFVAGTPGCTDLNCKTVFASGGLLGSAPIFKFEAGVVLPAKFSNLSGMGSTDGNQLFWTAFSQEAVSYFMVERSADGVNFTSVGSKVYPAGTNAESYKWLDNNIIAGKNYYRVKVMEATGGIYYTNTIVITAKNGGQWFTQLSHGNLILNNIKVQKGYVNTKVMNAAGQTIVTKSWNQHGGAFNQSVPLPVTAKGIYYVSIENAGTVSSFKIFVN